jgi:hypothetical protein
MQIKDDPFEPEIERKTQEIKSAMGSLGARLERGDESELLYWVIPNLLACAHRPLRHHPVWGGSGKNLAPAATNLVIEWSQRVLDTGIRSIISLMHDRDIRCYQSLNLGTENLIEFYKQQGFQVAHVPWEDPHHKKSSHEEKRVTHLKVRQQALTAYDDLPKPVLVQCSAGIDRSSPVAAFISIKRHTAP